MVFPTLRTKFLGEETSSFRIASCCHGGNVVFMEPCTSKMMVKLQDYCLVYLQMISEQLIGLLPKFLFGVLARTSWEGAPFQQLVPQNQFYSSAISIMMSFQPGRVVAVGATSSSWKLQRCRRVHCLCVTFIG